MAVWQGGVECRERGGVSSLGTLHVTDEELVFVRGGSSSSSRLIGPLVGIGLLLSTCLPVMLLTEPSGNYYAEGGRAPGLLLGALGCVLVLVGLTLAIREARTRRRALAELARSDGTEEGMGLDQRYAVSPGAWRWRLDQVERVRRRRGGLRVVTTLGDDLRLLLSERDGLEAALARATRG